MERFTRIRSRIESRASKPSATDRNDLLNDGFQSFGCIQAARIRRSTGCDREPAHPEQAFPPGQPERAHYHSRLHRREHEVPAAHSNRRAHRIFSLRGCDEEDASELISNFEVNRSLNQTLTFKILCIYN